MWAIDRVLNHVDLSVQGFVCFYLFTCAKKGTLVILGFLFVCFYFLFWDYWRLAWSRNNFSPAVTSGIIITQYYFIYFCWGAGVGMDWEEGCYSRSSWTFHNPAGLPIGRVGTAYLLLHALNSWLRLIFFINFLPRKPASNYLMPSIKS